MALAWVLAGCWGGGVSGVTTTVPPQEREALRREAAELRQDGAMVLDLHGPGASRYVGGGARCPWTRLETERRGPTRLAIGLPGAGISRVVVHVDGKRVGYAQPTTRDGATWVELLVPDKHLLRGEHILTVWGRSGGAGRSLAPTWVRVDYPARSRKPLRPEPPPVAPPVDDGTLALRPGWSAAWTLEVPDGARLVLGVAGAPGALLTASAVAVPAGSGAGTPRPLGVVAPLGGVRDASFDLSHLAGETVRLELGARGGRVELLSPAVVAPGAEPPDPPPPARNVIVYLVDTLRADHLRVYRPEAPAETPHLDRWAADAAVFDAAVSQAPWTKPSVATLLTGLLPWEHGATTHRALLRTDVPTLPELLLEQGFETTAFVTNSYVSRRFGLDRGFSTFANNGLAGRSDADLLVHDVLRWLDERPSDRPFFAYVHATEPHSPYDPPAEILHRYDSEPYDGPVDFAADPMLLRSISEGRLELSARDRRRLTALYDGEIAHHDLAFGALLEGLAARGLDRNTLFVFLSDHGEELFDHGSVGHGQSVHAELVHVPLIVRHPALGATRIAEPVGVADLMPTILEAVGLPAPPGLAGRSLLTSLQGAGPTVSRPVVSCRGPRAEACAIVGDRYKLVVDGVGPRRSLQLFDREADPTELRDMAAERPRVARRLWHVLALLRERPGGDAPALSAQVALDDLTASHLRALGYTGD